jgi:hypothetical protein
MWNPIAYFFTTETRSHGENQLQDLCFLRVSVPPWWILVQC